MDIYNMPGICDVQMLELEITHTIQQPNIAQRYRLHPKVVQGHLHDAVSKILCSVSAEG